MPCMLPLRSRTNPQVTGDSSALKEVIGCSILSSYILKFVGSRLCTGWPFLSCTLTSSKTRSTATCKSPLFCRLLWPFENPADTIRRARANNPIRSKSEKLTRMRPPLVGSVRSLAFCRTRTTLVSAPLGLPIAAFRTDTFRFLLLAEFDSFSMGADYRASDDAGEGGIKLADCRKHGNKFSLQDIGVSTWPYN